jgi:hypothetical protein
VDYLAGAVLKGSVASWREFVVPDVSDVDDAHSIGLMPSDTGLTLAFLHAFQQRNPEMGFAENLGVIRWRSQ